MIHRYGSHSTTRGGSTTLLLWEPYAQRGALPLAMRKETPDYFGNTSKGGAHASPHRRGCPQSYFGNLAPLYPPCPEVKALPHYYGKLTSQRATPCQLATKGAPERDPNQ